MADGRIIGKRNGIITGAEKGKGNGNGNGNEREVLLYWYSILSSLDLLLLLGRALELVLMDDNMI